MQCPEWFPGIRLLYFDSRGVPSVAGFGNWLVFLAGPARELSMVLRIVARGLSIPWTPLRFAWGKLVLSWLVVLVAAVFLATRVLRFVESG